MSRMVSGTGPRFTHSSVVNLPHSGHLRRARARRGPGGELKFKSPIVIMAASRGLWGQVMRVTVQGQHCHGCSPRCSFTEANFKSFSCQRVTVHTRSR